MLSWTKETQVAGHQQIKEEIGAKPIHSDTVDHVTIQLSTKADSY